MSAKPHSYSTMEPILGSSICLICFQRTENHIFVTDAPEKLFVNCNKYLHSTLTKGTLEDIELHNENQVSLCKRCFDSAFELTQLSEQLTTIQKDISDLTVAFSMAVFHRRIQVYSIDQSCKTSSIVEFNEACLPPNLFSMKLGDQNIHPNKNNQEMDIIKGLHLQTDISNVKCEASDIQFDNLYGNPQQSVANDNVEIQFNQENVDNDCGQSTIEQNLASVSETRIVHITGRNDSKKCANPSNGVELAKLDLLKSVKMPNITLERIKIVGHKLDVSVVNSNQTKCESNQKNLDETLFEDDEFSVQAFAPKSPGDGKLLQCLYCENTFTQECHRTLHHKTHTRDKIYKRPLVKQKFFYRNNQKTGQENLTGKKPFYKCSYCEKGAQTPRSLLKIHERTHTREKPFKCSYCNSRFNQSNNLKTHERIHTGEKPFKCSICNNRFSRSTSLKLHEKTHTGEKPFKCSFCNNRFTRRSHLKSHEIIHTREKLHKCLYCEKTFSGIRDKNSHQKCHPEQTSSLVSQFTNQKDGSTGHLKQEEQMDSAGPMEFKCSFCKMTFRHAEERANHEKIHIKKDEIVNDNLIVGI